MRPQNLVSKYPPGRFFVSGLKADQVFGLIGRPVISLSAEKFTITKIQSFFVKKLNKSFSHFVIFQKNLKS